MSAHRLLRLFVLAVGLFFVVLSISGFAAISDESSRGGDLRGGNPPGLLWDLFGVSTVLNFIHFLLGALTIATAIVAGRSKVGLWTVVIGFGLVVGYDIVSLAARPGYDPLAVNPADLWLHAVTLVIMVAMAVLPVADDRRPARTSRSAGVTVHWR
ncbi:hypothetical protein JOF56_010314 [Kibdelosporangium banguiense]|uniref:DUF4383 domain-containing protein n=1 Tax=Kibdelosporangium banguiense TaxID=1365924 RepID=A0ABS4TZU0_9PSEU|nr:DUF4383 domain-containing protein [Kibdelosporangium banguiense]MBP2329929.1 hypothetical protein [Kibdelosporangium banguiense]